MRCRRCLGLDLREQKQPKMMPEVHVNVPPATFNKARKAALGGFK